MMPLKQQAQKHFRKGQYGKARELYMEILEQNRGDAEALYMMGSTYSESGNFQEAAEYFQKTVNIQPNALVAQCALGAALKRLGKFPQAETAFRTAVELKPDMWDAGLELANVLLAQNKLEEAKKILKTLSRQNQPAPEAFHGLGEIAQEQQVLDDAIRYYQKALELQPGRPTTHNRLGTALYRKGRIAESIVQFEKAVVQQPEYPEAMKNMGLSYLTTGRLEEAKRCFTQAITLQPDYIAAIAGQATALEQQGEHEAAYAMIQPLIENHVEDANIGSTFSEICQTLGRCEEAVGYLKQLVESRHLSTSGCEQAHHALGKLLDRLQQYDSAFEHFRTANDMRTAATQPMEYSAVTATMINTFNWNFLSRAKRSSIETDRPVFLIGMPRSGTSLTEQILSSHPEIEGAGELPDIGNIVEEIDNGVCPESRYPHCLAEVPEKLLTTFAGRYLQCLEKISVSARFVTDKMPQNFCHLGLIALLFPNARIIHCRRDPIDTCLSIYFQRFSQGHDYAARLEHIAYYYLDYTRLMDHWKSVLRMPILDMDYSKLVHEPEQETRRLLEFIGVSWTPDCLDFHKSKRHTGTASYHQVRQPIYTSSVCRSRHYEKHIGPLKKILRSLYRD